MDRGGRVEPGEMGRGEKGVGGVPNAVRRQSLVDRDTSTYQYRIQRHQDMFDHGTIIVYVNFADGNVRCTSMYCT